MALGKFNRHYLDMPPHKYGKPHDMKSLQNRLQDGHLRNIKPVDPIFYKDIGTDNAMQKLPIDERFARNQYPDSIPVLGSHN